MKKIVPIRSWIKITLLVTISFLTGCLESSFVLSPESRLPKWLKVSPKISRTDLKVTMDYYSTFSGGEYIFKLYQEGSFFRVQKITVDIADVKNIALKGLSQSQTDYPKYYTVTVNGITDIVEYKKMEPIFYMVDDPAIWKELDVEQK
jgi:hypothetical protein